MTENQDILREAGLTNWEAKAIRALTELGECTTGPLVERSGIPQSKIYAVLDSLQKKGLVSHILKGKIKHFQAGDPEKILVLFKEKESRITEQVRQLKELGKLKKTESSVQMFEGLRAIRTVNSELFAKADKGEEFYGYSEGIGYTKEINELYQRIGELKKNSEIKDRLLITGHNKKEFEASIPKDQLRHVISKTRYTNISFPQDTAIFKDTVLIYIWEEKPKLIVIKNENTARNYKEFFMELWNSAKTER
jgi:HTH-type transcriptional regulator, sugar sensing transcriptional regulator